MKTNTISRIVLVVVVVLIVGYFGARASCSKDITFTPASSMGVGVIESSKGEKYTYNKKDYGSQASAVSACIATRFGF
jgi:hypothetical protein